MLLDVGFSVGATTASELKERFLYLNELLTGSRLLRGIAAIGGVRRDPEDTPLKRQVLREMIVRGKQSFEDLVDLIMSSSSALDRLETTGTLSHTDAYRLGITGIAGRASGIDRDFRRDHPHCTYPFLNFRVATRKEGDVLARMNVRIDEVRESFTILEQLQHQHLAEQSFTNVATIPPLQHALGYVEGWRGEIVHWVMTDKSGNIYRWKITDPSFHNWRFNLSYSGNDR
jgi:Ni,Fe-hydrogenase III large subunit